MRGLALRALHRWRALHSSAPGPAGGTATRGNTKPARRAECLSDTRRTDGPDFPSACPHEIPGDRGEGHRRPRPAAAGRGLVHEFVHQVIHTNGRSVNARAERAWTGPAASRLRPGHAVSRVSPRPGRGGQDPAVVVAQVEPSNGSSARSRQPSRSTQSASDATAAEPAMPDRGLLHAAEERPEAELARTLEHRLRGRDPAALRELDVDALDDADERVEVLVADRALVRHDRQRSSVPGATRGRGRRGPGTAARSARRPARRARAAGARRRRASSPCWRRPGSGPSKTPRTARSVARSSGPPHLILSAGKSAARRARSATTAGSSMPIVKSVGGIAAGRPISS